VTLAQYLTGEFDNREQAIAEPVWYAHLKLWHCPVPLFTKDSITLFAEQANVLTLDQPYRQRLRGIKKAKLKIKNACTIAFLRILIGTHISALTY